MRRQEDLLAMEISLLEDAGRRYGLLLEWERRRKQARIRKEARGAIEQTRNGGTWMRWPRRPGPGGSPTGN